MICRETWSDPTIPQCFISPGNGCDISWTTKIWIKEENHMQAHQLFFLPTNVCFQTYLRKLWLRIKFSLVRGWTSWYRKSEPLVQVWTNINGMNVKYVMRAMTIHPELFGIQEEDKHRNICTMQCNDPAINPDFVNLVMFRFEPAWAHCDIKWIALFRNVFKVFWPSSMQVPLQL